MSANRYCEKCGALLAENVKFCGECGHPIREEYAWGKLDQSSSPIPPTEKVDIYPNYSTADQFIPTNQDAGAQIPAPRRNWILIGAGIAVIACCVIAAAFTAGSYLMGDESSFPRSLLSDPTATPLPARPTKVPTQIALKPTQEPTLPPLEPTQTKSGLTGLQRFSDIDFFDDFSSNALNWEQSADENSAVGYEDGKYFIQLNVPDYRHLVFTPVNYLTHLEFKAEVASGAKNGAFGVACYWEDIDNHHFVYFDLDANNYILGNVKNAEWTYLIDPKDLPKQSGPQRYAVDCTPGLITVYVNDLLSSEHPVSQPVQAYKMLLGVMGWKDASPGGIKVLFEDVSGFRAMQ